MTEVQALLDRQAIHDMLMRYLRGVDRCDAELITSAYHPDAVDEHGLATYTGETVGQGLCDLVGIAGVSMHHITNHAITLHGDWAGCESYYIAWQGVEFGAQHRVLQAIGRYIDRFERRGGEWKIAHRLVIVEHTHLVPEDGAFPPVRPGLGSRDRGDPSYAVL